MIVDAYLPLEFIPSGLKLVFLAKSKPNHASCISSCIILEKIRDSCNQVSQSREASISFNAFHILVLYSLVFLTIIDSR
jgi:hypothetical protein